MRNLILKGHLLSLLSS